MKPLPPLIVHVVFRFGIGGLENGVVNLINRMPPSQWRHAVLALTEVSPEFARRIDRPDVRCIALGKKDGHLVREYPRLYGLFRELEPAVVHTRNLAALEAVVPAWAAGVPVRIHGEHGWDMQDPAGKRRRYRHLRRLYRPFVNRYIALSHHLEDYLEQCRAYSADPASGFVRRATVSQAFPDGWVTVTRDQVIGSRGGQRLDRPIKDDADWRRTLRELLDVKVTPEGRVSLGAGQRPRLLNRPSN